MIDLDATVNDVLILCYCRRHAYCVSMPTTCNGHLRTIQITTSQNFMPFFLFQ